MIERNFEVRKTARWFATSDINEKTEVVHVVLHGYGQLAARFLKKFEAASGESSVWLAPEGLHRFYTDEAHQKIGASWMTRECRECDISDTLKYLEDWLAQIEVPRHVKLHLLGFSQGAATAVRWFCSSGHPFASLTLWAGSFPPDVSIEFHAEKFRSVPIVLVAGKTDSLVPVFVVQSVHAKLKSFGANVVLVEHTGGHAIFPEVLSNVNKFIND